MDDGFSCTWIDLSHLVAEKAAAYHVFFVLSLLFVGAGRENGHPSLGAKEMDGGPQRQRPVPGVFVSYKYHSHPSPEGACLWGR